MEGPHPHLLGNLADVRLDARPHLARRLVGKGDREQAVRPDLAGGDQIGDPGGQHAGLAGARAGEDEERPLHVLDRLPLLGIEPIQDLGQVGLNSRGGGH